MVFLLWICLENAKGRVESVGVFLGGQLGRWLVKAKAGLGEVIVVVAHPPKRD
jgi:hypothetical protein